MTTQQLSQRVEMIDAEVKNLELQQQSDITTIQYLQQEITALQNELSELSAMPDEIEAEEKRSQAAFEEAMREMEHEEETGLREELARLHKEHALLAREIELQQSKLRQVTNDRDQLKHRWTRLKDDISKHDDHHL